MPPLMSATRDLHPDSLDIQNLPVFDEISTSYPSAIASVDICRKQNSRRKVNGFQAENGWSRANKR